MKIIDCFLFFNEQNLLEERISVLNDVVDCFLILEFGETFSGYTKSQSIDLSFLDTKTAAKVQYLFIQKAEGFNPRHNLATTNYNRSLSWKHNGRKPIDLEVSNKREISHRDALAELIFKFAEDGDLIMVSDIDEIPNPATVRTVKVNADFYLKDVSYLEMDWRIYFSDYVCEHLWYGTYITSLSILKNFSVDELRVSSHVQNNPNGRIIADGGIHLSYLGGIPKIMAKLEALGNQGMRALIAKTLVKYFPRIALLLLKRGIDLLLQGRKFTMSHDNTKEFISENFLAQHSLLYELAKKGK